MNVGYGARSSADFLAVRKGKQDRHVRQGLRFPSVSADGGRLLGHERSRGSRHAGVYTDMVTFVPNSARKRQNISQIQKIDSRRHDGHDSQDTGPLVDVLCIMWKKAKQKRDFLVIHLHWVYLFSRVRPQGASRFLPTNCKKFTIQK